RTSIRPPRTRQNLYVGVDGKTTCRVTADSAHPTRLDQGEAPGSGAEYGTGRGPRWEPRPGRQEAGAMNGTKPQGLSAAEVAVRVQRGQVNRVRRSDWADYRAILARNVATLFNALVVPAAVALFWLEEYRGAAAVSGMAVLNTLLGLVQEIRAKRHLDKLAI